MPKKSTNKTSDATPKGKRTRGRKPTPEKGAAKIPATLTRKDVKTLTQIADRVHTTQGALAILALSELFKWVEAIYKHLTSPLAPSASSRRSPSVASTATALLGDLMKLHELTTHVADAARPGTGKRRGRPRNVQAKASANEKETAAPKRRGRPRNVQAEAPASERETAAPKRRGRPRNVQAEAPASEKETAAPKRRGRPRKNALPEAAGSPNATLPDQKKQATKKRKASKSTAKTKEGRPARKRKTRTPKKRASAPTSRKRTSPAPADMKQPTPSAMESTAPLTAPEKPSPTNAVQE